MHVGQFINCDCMAAISWNRMMGGNKAWYECQTHVIPALIPKHVPALTARELLARALSVNEINGFLVGVNVAIATSVEGIKECRDTAMSG